MTARRPSVNDLYAAADWLCNYEAEDGDGAYDPDQGPYTGTDQVAAQMYRVAAWLEAEARRRQREAAIREVAKMVAERTGRKATDPAVMAKAREAYDAQVAKIRADREDQTR